MRAQLGFVGLAVAAVAAAAFAGAGPSQDAAAPTSAQPDLRPSTTRSAIAAPPLAFEPNVGQVAPHIAYIAHRGQHWVELRPTGATMTLAGLAARTVDGASAEAPDRIALDLVGADATARMTTADPLPVTADDVAAYGRVTAEQALPGIDLAWYSTGGELDYDLRVVPGAEVDEIRMLVTGAERLTLDADGALLVHTLTGTFAQPAPVAYQEIDGQRHEVVAGYKLEGDRYGFTVGAYDLTRPLIIG